MTPPTTRHPGEAPLDKPLASLVGTYLETVRDGSGVCFRLPRSGRVDQLLIAMSAGDAVLEPLGQALDRLVRDTRAVPPAGAALRRLAAEVDARGRVIDKLERYLDGLSQMYDVSVTVDRAEFEFVAEPPDGSLEIEPFAADDHGRGGELQREVSRMREEIAQLRTLLAIDELTGLRNLLYFHQRLDEEISRAERESAELSIVAIDVVGLAAINRTRGRAAGDELLRRVGFAAERSLRQYDICCRGDDDEFLLILPGASADICAQVIARVRSLLDFDQELEVSIGSATFGLGGTTLATLLASLHSSHTSDKRRIHSGEVVIDSVPPSMVERERLSRTKPTTVWFEGMAQGVRVEAAPRNDGVRLRAPLPFLRLGSNLMYSEEEGAVSSGRLVRAALHASTEDQVPVLQLDIGAAAGEG